MILGLQTLSLRTLTHKKWMMPEMRLTLNRKKVQQYAREKQLGAHFPAPVKLDKRNGALMDRAENHVNDRDAGKNQ